MPSEPSSFAFIPRAVKKRNHPSVSNYTPSASIPVGAQVTSASTLPLCVNNSRGVKVENDDDEHTSGPAAGAGTKQFQPATTLSNTSNRKDLFDIEDLAQLVCLSLSDYAVWADVDLRRKIDRGNGQDPYDDDIDLLHDTSIDGDKGYIPLAYLLRHSQVFHLLSSSSSPILSQPQTTFIKAIRIYASHLIDVRLIIPSSSSSTAHATRWTTPHIQTGYELRKKEASSALSEHGKKEWDALTIYVENIPNHYRSILGIIKFLNGLISPLSSVSNSSVPRIQNISLPAHHQDQPNSVPTCKGFALVTLSDNEIVDALLKTWPWDRPTDSMSSDQQSTVANAKGKGKDQELPDEKISPFQVEAVKFGLRVLTKVKWEELRAEYLLYRQELVDEINILQDEGEATAYGGGGQKKGYVDETYDQEEQITGEDSQYTNQIHVQKNAYVQSQPNKKITIDANNSVDATGVHPNSAYPPGCLVFLRNVHPDTNKTTLRNLFLHAQEPGVDSGSEGGQKDDDGLDYLDYTKGMDCCHVRLRTHMHAQQFVHNLSSNPVIQTSGLDALGTSPAHQSLSDKVDLQSKPIIADQVLGKREEVYWEKVPEKIKRQAVEKALSLLHSISSCSAGSAPIAGPSEGDTTKTKRKLEEHQTQSIDFSIHVNSAYPPGCLVFIRNVHPETNKTTLQSLFLHAREEGVDDEDLSGKKDEDGIDYLDYTKGLDCCHVRLRTPLHAQQLVHHLSSSPIAQITGLDASGSRLASLSASSSQLKPLVAEQLLGKRQEVYWEKVPEKVRRQAVEKALSSSHGGGDGGGASSVHAPECSKPKKRRKK